MDPQNSIPPVNAQIVEEGPQHNKVMIGIIITVLLAFVGIGIFLFQSSRFLRTPEPQPVSIQNQTIEPTIVPSIEAAQVQIVDEVTAVESVVVDDGSTEFASLESDIQQL